MQFLNATNDPYNFNAKAANFSSRAKQEKQGDTARVEEILAQKLGSNSTNVPETQEAPVFEFCQKKTEW